jgi:hypothetical protein
MNSGLAIALQIGVCVFFASANAVLARTKPPPESTSTSATNRPPTLKPLTTEYWLHESQLTNATRSVLEQATAATDTELAAAAEYNLLHIPLAGTNGPAIDAVLERLEIVGDEFTVRWLEMLARRPEPDLFRPQLLAARSRIEKRLATAPARPPEALVRERWLRAAVANATCNPLESPLPQFVKQWANSHTAEPLFRAELQKLAAGTGSTQDLSWVAAVRRLAAMRAARLLEPAQPGSK